MNCRRSARDLVNLKIDNKVAILYSVDSANALQFMPYVRTARIWLGSR